VARLGRCVLDTRPVVGRRWCCHVGVVDTKNPLPISGSGLRCLHPIVFGAVVLVVATV
jgi:hypothetical protein